MKHLLRVSFSFFLFGSFVSSCDTASDFVNPEINSFIKYYGGDGDQQSVDMLLVSDGILLLGNSTLGAVKKVALIKVDFNGHIVWEKIFSGPSDVAVDLEPALDGNFAILTRNEANGGDLNFKLIRVSAVGDKIDSVSYGTVKNDFPRSVTSLSDGGFIVSGATQFDTTAVPLPNQDEYLNMFHFRCNASLDFNIVDWYPFYGSQDRYDSETKVFAGESDNFYVFGYSDFVHPQNAQGKLALIYLGIGSGAGINGLGFTGDNTQNTISAYVIKVPMELGGGFLHLGTRVNAEGPTTLQMTKMRSPLMFSNANDEQFDKELNIVNRPVEGVAAAPSLLSPEGYLLLSDEMRNQGTKNILLQKVDLLGGHLWSVSLGSEDGNDEASAVLELPDGKILVLGTVELGDNQTKMGLFKLNTLGRLQ